MIQPIDYESNPNSAPHLWRSLFVAGAIGLAWGCLPIGILFYNSGLSFSVACTTGWSAVVGILAGLLTIWTRRRNGGSETPAALLLTYFGAIFVFCFAPLLLAILQTRAIAPFAWHAQLLMIASEAIADLLDVLGYAAVFGIILVPLCYVCRECVWKLYTRHS